MDIKQKGGGRRLERHKNNSFSHSSHLETEMTPVTAINLLYTCILNARLLEPH